MNAYKLLKKTNQKYMKVYPSSAYWFKVISPADRGYTLVKDDLEPVVLGHVFEDKPLTLDDTDFVSLLYNYLLRTAQKTIDHELEGWHVPIIAEIHERVVSHYNASEDALKFLDILRDAYVLMLFKEGTTELTSICLFDRIGPTTIRYIHMPDVSPINRRHDEHLHVSNYLRCKYPDIENVTTVVRTTSILTPYLGPDVPIDLQNPPVILGYNLYNMGMPVQEYDSDLTYGVHSNADGATFELESVVVDERDIYLESFTISSCDEYIGENVPSEQGIDFKISLRSNPYFRLCGVFERIYGVPVNVGTVAYTVYPNQVNSCIYLHVCEAFRGQGIGTAILRTIEHQICEINEWPLIKVHITDAKVAPFFQQAGYSIDSCEISVYR